MRWAIFIPLNSRPSLFFPVAHTYALCVIGKAQLSSFFFFLIPFAAAAAVVMNTDSFTATSGVKQNEGGGRREEETTKGSHLLCALWCGFTLVCFSHLGFKAGVIGRDVVMTELGFHLLLLEIILFGSIVAVLVSAWFLVQHVLALTRFRTGTHLLDQSQENYSINSDSSYKNHLSPSQSPGKLCDAV